MIPDARKPTKARKPGRARHNKPRDNAAADGAENTQQKADKVVDRQGTVMVQIPWQRSSSIFHQLGHYSLNFCYTVSCILHTN